MACGIPEKSNVGYYVQLCSEPGCNDIDLRDIIYDGWMFFLSVNYLCCPKCNALWLLMVGRKRFSVKRELISDSRQPEAGNRDTDRKPELWAFTRHKTCHSPHCSVIWQRLITAQMAHSNWQSVLPSVILVYHSDYRICKRVIGKGVHICSVSYYINNDLVEGDSAFCQSEETLLIEVCNGQFYNCQSWLFIIVHSQFWSNGLGLYA